MSTLTELERGKKDFQSQITQEEERHKKTMAALNFELRTAQTQINMHCANLDVARILHAEHVLVVRGKFKAAGKEKSHAIKYAKDAILTGGGKLFDQYCGTKNYDRFHGQFVDFQYGFGPSHGSVVFSIGFTPAIRGANIPLSDEQIEDCLYYLNNLEAIQEAKGKA